MPEQTPINVPMPPLPGQSERKSKTGLIIGIILIVLVIGAAAAYYFLVYSKDNTGDNLNKTAIVSNTNSGVITSISNTNVITPANVNTDTTNVYTFLDNSNFEIINGLPSQDILDEINDSDGDGLLTNLEVIYGTNEKIVDTDGDGYDDFAEINGCYNPNGPGRMNLEMYYSYCNNFYKDLVEYGTLTNESANDLCVLWEDYVFLELSNKEEGNSDSIWDDISFEVIDDRCQQFNLEHSIEVDEDSFGVCGGSVLVSSLFCNIPKPS